MGKAGVLPAPPRSLSDALRVLEDPSYLNLAIHWRVSDQDATAAVTEPQTQHDGSAAQALLPVQVRELIQSIVDQELKALEEWEGSTSVPPVGAVPGKRLSRCFLATNSLPHRRAAVQSLDMCDQVLVQVRSYSLLPVRLTKESALYLTRVCGCGLFGL